MSVTVDRQTLEAERMGFQTVGQVLSHLQRDNRLVVHVLLDGTEPDLARLNATKQVPLQGHTLYIETAEPATIARQALGEVESQLSEAERLKGEAAALLQKGQTVKAMERLSGCFTTWQHAQQSMLQTGALLRISLDAIEVEGRPLSAMLSDFTQQLRDIREALEQRDFVALADILQFETSDSNGRWCAALAAMRQAIDALK